jgi:hypothetical protein
MEFNVIRGYPNSTTSITLPHSKLVPKRRSPMSPNPGFTYPLSSKSGSIAPTNMSVHSGYALATFSRPVALPSKENNVIRSTPQSLNDHLALVLTLSGCGSIYLLQNINRCPRCPSSSHKRIKDVSPLDSRTLARKFIIIFDGTKRLLFAE